VSTVPHVATARMPAEWAPHERTLIGWPCRVELWGEEFEAAKRAYAEVANAIAAFEPVTMAANPLQLAEARAALSADVDVLAMALDDSWLRDSGPLFVLDAEGRRTGVHFRFNAWGEKFRPYDADVQAGGRLAAWLGDPVVEAPLVLEGGSIAVDGEGALMTTEQCLLHPTRNPDLSREEIEAELRRYLGVERCLWLGQGLLEDRDTDGHVDLVAAFTAPGKVLLQMVDEANPNHPNCLDNAKRLEGAGLEVRTLDWLPYDRVAGQEIAVPYMNFYVCNGAVVVPVAGQETDAQALQVIGECYPGREIVPVDGVTLAFGGGGPHCITQQVPAQGT
jgi:agmatine deiminase